MKNIIIISITIALMAVSCKSNEKDQNTVRPESKTTSSPENTAPAPAKENHDGLETIIASYLDLKNDLTKDDSAGAAEKAKVLYELLGAFDAKNGDAKKHKAFVDISDDAKENAEHISENTGEIEHQREHFVMLSKDISDLIALDGTKRKLYLDYCPMADQGRGATWISETKKISNPYLGIKMPTCGAVKKEI